MAAAAAQEATDAAVLGKTIRSCAEATRVFRSAIGVAQSLAGQFFYTLAILLVLFIVHQIFIWIDQDPEKAFDRGALLFEVAEVSWDTTGILWNAAVDVFNAGVIPLWNAAAFYVAEPLIVLILEIFSLLFTRQHWQGVFSEADFPYFGLDCTASLKAAQWCGNDRDSNPRPSLRIASPQKKTLCSGRYEYYSQQLESADKAPYFTDQSQAYARRSRGLFDPYHENYTFGIATARRLSELSGSNDLVTPAVDTAAMTTALDDFSILFITLGPTVADVAFAVLVDVLQTSFSVIADALFLVLKALLAGLRWLIKSGMITTLVTVGVDFVIIYFTEIAIPLLFAGIDFITCIIDFFQPSGWTEQLSCVEKKCFKGTDAVADLLVFWSLPVLMHRFTAIMEATLNSRTGKRFFKVMSGQGFTSEGRTTNPDTGETLENTEPESASFSNPTYEFEFADQFASFLPTTGADKCGGCFVCKWPELRILWLIVAGIASLVSPTNVAMFVGNVSQHCLTNGSWYERACGPWPTSGDDTCARPVEQIPFQYDAGFHELDATIYDEFAATLIERSEEIGAAADDHFALLVEASHAWMQLRDSAPYDALLQDAIQAGRVPVGTEFPTFEEPKAAAFTYHVCRVARYEAKKREQLYDSHNDYHLRAPGSIEALTNEFLFDTCKRFKFETYTNAGRDIQGVQAELYACTLDRVACKKSEIACLATCAGVDGTEYHHDFATIVGLTELSEFVLGEADFNNSAPANCSVKNVVLELDTFAGGDSFKTFAARVRTRSGMTAIGTRAHAHAHESVRGSGLIRCARVQIRRGARPTPRAAASSSACSSAARASSTSTGSSGTRTTAWLLRPPRRRPRRRGSLPTRPCPPVRRRRPARRRPTTLTLKIVFLSRGSPTTASTPPWTPSTAQSPRSASAACSSGGSWRRSAARRPASRASPVRTRPRPRPRSPATPPRSRACSHCASGSAT